MTTATPDTAKTITVAELRQNPTEALNAVEAGETYLVTRHNRPIARLVPVYEWPRPRVVKRAKEGPVDFSGMPDWDVKTANSIDELLEEMKSEW